MKKHKKKMRKLDKFIIFMNSLSDKQLSYTQVRGLLYFDKSARFYKEKLPENYSRFTKEFGRYRYRSPSILDIGKGWGTDYSHKLTAQLHPFYENGKRLNIPIPIIYDKGKWKILSYIPGT